MTTPPLNEKQCVTCGEVKPLDQFHRERKMRDGHCNECKPCAIARAAKWERDNPGRKAAASRRWRKENPEKAAAQKRRWRENNRDRIAVHEQRRWEDHPEKVRARRALNDALRKGDQTKPPGCESCDEEVDSRELHGHHHDYSKPLEVEWLCRSCHLKAHEKERVAVLQKEGSGG
jgi:hypothetical protein